MSLARRLVSLLTSALAGALLAASLVVLGLSLAYAAGVDVRTPLRAALARLSTALEASGAAPAANRAIEGFGRVLEVRRELVGPTRANRVIYLNREGARLTAGIDDATRNRSSIVAASQIAEADIAAWTGSASRWRSLVQCVQKAFEPYDVEVVDRRPVEGSYVMAVIGGTAATLGPKTPHHHALGLAPFNGEPIEDAVVLIFSAATKNELRTTSEAAAMEVAHAFGLDHGYHCRDFMTYRPYCGTKRFVDEDVRCGEHQPRDCKGGAKTQNSHRHLLRLFGPRKP
jgi:hypothetical protein